MLSIRKVALLISLLIFAVSVDTSFAKKIKATKKTKSTKKTKKQKKSKKDDKNTIRLSPGQSIQEALDTAPDNTIIYLEPGDYTEEGNLEYGLRISKNNIRLIGTSSDGQATRILPTGTQQVGVYAAPEKCEYNDNECDSRLLKFSIQDIVVEGFPQNGIQTRFVDGFKFSGCKSINNLKNGIYPTLSTDGVVKGCTSIGSLDAGIWIAGSRQVKVLDNSVSDSVTGIEVTVSKDVFVSNNDVFHNVVGIGMFHANMAGTSPDFPPYDNWVFENNRVFDNNRENNAPPGTFQSALPSGIGILMVGIRGQTVSKNFIEGNKFVGLTMIGFCTVQGLIFGVGCDGPNSPIDGDPSANNNTIVSNAFAGNGYEAFLEFPGSDIIYLQQQIEFLGQPNVNCFKDNTGTTGEPASFSATDFVNPFIPLPIGGCL